MQLKFDANQDYQLEAIQAIADLFIGQRRLQAELKFGDGAATFAAIANRLDLSEVELLANLHTVQARHNITPDPSLASLERTVDIAGKPRCVHFPNFSIEMETGTGKTYVYLRTILQLYHQYGLRKFIVVVPSVPIREGVLATLRITRAHFQDIYANPPYSFFAYNSGNLSQIRQFALTEGVSIMVMTLAAFNKDSNIIRQSTDRLQGETPINLVQATRPVLILDEPQDMESELSIASLAMLHPLFALRYSATHRVPYNVVYRLTPFEAYNRGLVKRIEVASVVRENATAAPYLRLIGVETDKHTLAATLAVYKRFKDGTIREATIKVRPGDSLKDKTNRSEYAAYTIDHIDIARSCIRFTNTERLVVAEELGADREVIFEAQIRAAIREHFEKQEDCRHLGIKVLSLFFIDRVDNYRRADGIIRQLFNRIFDEEKSAYPAWKDKCSEEVQIAYFAERKTKSGEIILEDSTSGESKQDQDAYDLILRKKEALLSFEEPRAFVFSHSALSKGWDNPNVFQICALNQTVSEPRRRQEVGRGVRICVNQAGDRVWDARVNILTVIANESYQQFAQGLQDQIAGEYRTEIEKRYGKSIADLTSEERRKIEAEYGAGILPPKVADRRQRQAVHLRKERLFADNGDFRMLWSKISAKTRYAVHIDSTKLVDDVLKELNTRDIRPPQVTLTKAVVQVGLTGSFEALQMSAAKTIASLVGRYPLPNLIDLLLDYLDFTTPRMRVTRRTLLAIIQGLNPAQQQAMLDNPNEFAKVTVAIIKEKLAAQLVDGIQYEKTGDFYEMTQFQDELLEWADRLVPAPNHSLYDHVAYDSHVERDFVRGLEARNDVLLYIKLPDWFEVATPIGKYRPDWAIVIQATSTTGHPIADRKCYLIRETKGAINVEDLQWQHEKLKTKFAKHHFESIGVNYEIVKESGDLKLPYDCASGYPASPIFIDQATT